MSLIMQVRKKVEDRSQMTSHLKDASTKREQI
jgi:hypothetical protein